MPERLTRVPLAAPEFAGMLNLRGRIVTAVDIAAAARIDASRGGQGRAWQSGSRARASPTAC